MSHAFHLLLALACALSAVGATDALDDAPVPLPAAATVMEALRAALPQTPQRVRAELTARDAQGREAPPVLVTAEWHVHADARAACYTLHDAFGAPREQLQITRRPDGVWERAYATGDPLRPALAPAPDDPVAGTDFTWRDLALDFLWWTNGVTIGREARKTRPCTVVEMTGPAADGAPPPRARLWVDERAHALLQAEALDDEGRPTRRLEVKSLRKVDEQWVVEDVEVRRPGRPERTRLRILNPALKSPDTAGEWEAMP